MKLSAIQLYQSDGNKIIGRALILDSPWEIFDKKIINEQMFYKISDTEWIKASDSDISQERQITSLNKSFKTGNGIGHLFTEEGHMIHDRALMPNTSVNVVRKMIMDDKEYYQIEDSDDWIDGKILIDPAEEQPTEATAPVEPQHVEPAAEPKADIDIPEVAQPEETENEESSIGPVPIPAPTPAFNSEPTPAEPIGAEDDMQDSDRDSVTTRPGDAVVIYSTSGKKERNRLLSSDVTVPTDKMMTINGVKMYRIDDDTWLSTDDIVEA